MADDEVVIVEEDGTSLAKTDAVADSDKVENGGDEDKKKLKKK